MVKYIFIKKNIQKIEKLLKSIKLNGNKLCDLIMKMILKIINENFDNYQN